MEGSCFFLGMGAFCLTFEHSFIDMMASSHAVRMDILHWSPVWVQVLCSLHFTPSFPAPSWTTLPLSCCYYPASVPSQVSSAVASEGRRGEKDGFRSFLVTQLGHREGSHTSPSPAPVGLRRGLEGKQTEMMRISTEARPIWTQLNLLLKR